MSLGTAQVSFRDWTGQTTPGGLGVIGLKSRRPVAWKVRCAACGAEATVPHSRIEFAECKSAACGQPVRKRTPDEEARVARVARERAALEEEARLADLRMQRETEGYEKPKRYTPPPTEPDNLTDRQRQAIRARRAEERREEEERQRPLREAEVQLQATHRRIQAAQRERLTNPDIQDWDVFIDPEVAGASMPQTMADGHNIEAFREFHKKHGDFFPTERNISLLHDYHLRNGCGIYTASMLGRVYERMRDAGVEFDAKPAPKPDQNALDYSKRPDVEVRIAEPVKPKPVVYEGIDLETGQPRTYTAFEVARMSGDEMKRKLRLGREDLSLRSLSPFNHPEEA